MNDRGGDGIVRERRAHDRRRPNQQIATEWQQMASNPAGYGGPDRRGGSDRRKTAPVTFEGVSYYSDEWARRCGASDFNAWLNRCAKGGR